MSLTQGGNKTLQGTAGSLADVDSTPRNPIGLEVPDEAGNVYKYLQGIGSVAAGDWVVFSGSGIVARALSTPLTGSLGVAMAAIVANKYGWFQIIGLVAVAGNGQVASAIATDSGADGKALFLSSSAGRLTTTLASTQAVLGAFASGAAASNVGNAWINRPFAPGFILGSA